MLLPVPVKTDLKKGYFKISPDVKILLNTLCGFDNIECIESLQNDIEKYAGIKTSFSKVFGTKGQNEIYLSIGSGKPQGYILTISTDKIIVMGNDNAGLFYGIQTLRQLIKVNRNLIPSQNIEDHPYFLNRGFYHDTTRGKVPTLNTLKELCDRLSYYKINQLELYIEHSFAFSDETEVWKGLTPLTAEEIIKLDEYCKKRYIELIPSISLFGHLYEVLNTNSYSDLCELDEKSKYYSWIDRQFHHTLDVSNPKSFEFVKKRISEFIPLFSSNKFNICCDETFDIGQGKNKELADKLGKGRLYVDFLNKIISYSKKYKKEIQFWDDIILKDSKYLSDIPSDIVCLTWDYSPDAKEEAVNTISKSGHRQYVCPGVSGWNHLMNDFDSASININKMIQYGKKYNAEGVLNTDWGDFGHINLFGSSIIGMIYGASLSWNAENELDIDEFYKDVSFIEYNDSSKSIGNILRNLSKQAIFNWGAVVVWKEMKLGHLQVNEESKKYMDLIPYDTLKTAYTKTNEICEQLSYLYCDIDLSRKLDMKEFIISTRAIALFDALCVLIKKYDYNENIEVILSPERLAKKLELWFYDYSSIWRERNNESELFRIKDAITEICDILRNY